MTISRGDPSTAPLPSSSPSSLCRAGPALVARPGRGAEGGPAGGYALVADVSDRVAGWVLVHYDRRIAADDRQI